MKIQKILFLCAIFFVVSCQENSNESCSHATQVSDLIHKDGTVTEAVIEILGQAGVRIKGMPVKEDWPAMVVELDSPHCENVKNLIQGKDPRYPNYSWFAKPGVERWDMSYEKNEINTPKLIALILQPLVNGVKGLNMGSATHPKSNSPSEILLLGSTLGDFTSRVRFLNTLMREGDVKPDKASIYILTGKRSFNESEKQILTKRGTADALRVLASDSERAGMEWVYSTFDKDSVFAVLPTITIDDANPKGVRATTESTFALFFKQTSMSKDKRILAVSTHIFALYQYLILKRVAFQNGFEGHVGICASALRGSERDAYPDSKKLAMLLDNLSRIFYEICLYKEKTGKYPF